MAAGNAVPSNSNVLIIAAGTAGHILPSAVLAEKLIGIAGVRVHWWGDRKALSALQKPEDMLSTGLLQTASPRRWQRLLSWRFYAQIFSDIKKMCLLLRSKKFRFVLVTGGIMGVIPAICAKWYRVPVFVYEQNVVLGFANALLQKIGVNHIFYGLPPIEPVLKSSYTAQPLRPPILHIQRMPKYSPEKKVLLVIGGSLGAHSFNTTLVQSLSAITALQCWQIIHLAGPQADCVAIAQQYQHPDVHVLNYVDHIDEIYARVDLVIARSGALTLSEIDYLQIPTVTIPLPQSAGDHQRANARVMMKRGYISGLEQNDVNPSNLEKMIYTSLMLSSFNEQTHAKKYHHAAQEITQQCLTLSQQI